MIDGKTVKVISTHDGGRKCLIRDDDGKWIDISGLVTRVEISITPENDFSPVVYVEFKASVFDVEGEAHFSIGEVCVDGVNEGERQDIRFNTEWSPVKGD